MKLSNNIKIIWWIILFVIFSFFLYFRYKEGISTNSTNLEPLLIIIWCAIAFVPIFSEVQFFGIKFKQEIENMKKDFLHQITLLKTEITSSIKSEQNTNISFPLNLSDLQIPRMEMEFRNEQKLDVFSEKQSKLIVQEEVMELFKIRHNIELDLRRISEGVFKHEDQKKLPILEIIKLLSEFDITPPKLSIVAKEVYQICTSVIHGESASKVQIDFVKRVSPDLVAALRIIGADMKIE